MRDEFLEFQEPRGCRSPSQQRHLTIMEKDKGLTALLCSAASLALKAGTAVVSSYLLQRAEHKAAPQSDRKIEVERHLPSLPLSPLLSALCGNICFLRRTFPSCGGRVLCAAPLALLF